MTEAEHVRFAGENAPETRGLRDSKTHHREMSIDEKDADISSTWSDDAYGVEERDFKKKQVCGTCSPSYALHSLTLG